MAEGVMVTGVYGCGKSTVAAELADQLERRNAAYAAIDLDGLMWFDAPGVHGVSSETVFSANLSAVVGNYLRVGIQHVVLAGAVRDRPSLDRLTLAVPVTLRVVRLKVPLTVIAQRLQADPTDARRADLDVAATWLADGTGSGLEEMTINNELPIADVATAILDWLAWPTSSGHDT